MTRMVMIIAALGWLAATSGCDGKSAAHGFCTGDDGTAQDCKICCDVDKARECCDKAKKLSAAQSEQ